MELAHLEALTEEQRRALLARSTPEDDEIRDAARRILDEVAERGDAALLERTAEFDGVALEALQLRPTEIAAQAEGVDAELVEAVDAARAHIERFHNPQALEPYEREIRPGVRAGQRVVPYERVGIYVPANLPSSLLMAAVPAQIAGVASLAVCTPPTPEGRAPDAVCATARQLGMETIHPVGGAQAIGALAYGTEMIPPVEMIVGPGNAYVTAAKALVRQQVGIDLLAGPSEVLVWVEPEDETRRVEAWTAWAAAELRAQLEHGPGTSAVLLTSSVDLAQRVAASFDADELAERHTAAIVYRDRERALAFVNAYAPEHLALWTADADELLPKVRHAGSVFLGPWAPVALGDFATGTNHVLPTSGRARWMSGLSVRSFQKTLSYQHVTPEGLGELAPTAISLAEAEGMAAHARSITLRQELDAEGGEGG